MYEMKIQEELSNLVKEENGIVDCSFRCCEQRRERQEGVMTRYQNEAWREKVSEWCYKVIDHLGDERELVYIAMRMLDRFVSMEQTTRYCSNKEEYRLAAMTALSLATKLFGRTPVEVEVLVKMSKGNVVPEELAVMEKAMLQSIPWKRRPLTPALFVLCILGFLPDSIPCNVRASILETAAFLVELSVCDYFFSGRSACDVAFAAVITSIEKSALPRPTLTSFYNEVEKVTGLRVDCCEVNRLRSRIEHVYKQSEETGQKARQPLVHVIPAENAATQVVPSSRETARSVSPEDFNGEVNATHIVPDVEVEESYSTELQKEKEEKGSKRRLLESPSSPDKKRVTESTQ